MSSSDDKENSNLSNNVDRLSTILEESKSCRLEKVSEPKIKM
jgi:hypothetical protein